MKKQTAVEWLQLQLNENGKLSAVDFYQAKQMEKEQKIKFANDYGFHICGYDYENAEEHYNKTFKQQTP